ncbi:glycerophosphodiester phosphodiesterase [Clostridium algidicarnis]|uniref:glycerophosphodiester phosphodiesterase n=1 Tax=Clostridium algidicarnis TaxID=37659 RepID=UPI001C0D3133|nr:glycerophosphodiester phosphodiesterase [Clostridium algidicarnis]MBU3194383.1 glycerophosphodiester phosphodiesterase [Clostridium algidicarnis]
MHYKSLNIAHRGFSGKYPENTMLAFEKAVEADCDGIETDVQLTKDNVLVLCHDETLDRTTSNKGFISQYTYKELKALDFGIKFGDKFKNIKIPTLEELLDYCKEKDIYLNLELKNSIILYEGLEEMVIKKIHEYNLSKHVILSSFNHYSMVKCKSIDNNIKTGLLYEAGLYKPHIYAQYVGADALHPHFLSVIHKDIVDDIKSKNILINTYTVNDENHMKTLINLGIDGIITNYPDKLSNLLKG